MNEDDGLYLFLNPDTYNQDRVYIDVEPSQGVTENYDPAERFLTRVSGDREMTFCRYGGKQSEYEHRMGEAALAMSYILTACDGDLDTLSDCFDDYMRGYVPGQRPHGIKDRLYSIPYDAPFILWTFTDTPCEKFFSYLAFHRHVMARNAKGGTMNVQVFGRNRYAECLGASVQQRRQYNNMLSTNLCSHPYLPSLEKFYGLGKNDKGKMFLLLPTFKGERIPCGYMKNGELNNMLVQDADYIKLYAHMNTLLLSIASPQLPTARKFLAAVFEIQYWYIVIMPLERGSLAVMNKFRYVMLAYYNRRQDNPERRLPLAPNRLDIYPDLEALLLRDTVEAFVNASFAELYCVDYNAYCSD